MTELSLLERAKRIAIERHGDQKYGNGLPYSWHLGKVADLLGRLGYSEEVQAGGWLHDTVEDTDTTLEEIGQLFGPKMSVMIEGVTFSEEEKRAGVSKIQKAMQNPGSHVIKFADSSVNFAASVLDGAPQQKSDWDVVVLRYGRYLIEELGNGLPTPAEVEEWLSSAT